MVVIAIRNIQSQFLYNHLDSGVKLYETFVPHTDSKTCASDLLNDKVESP